MVECWDHKQKAFPAKKNSTFAELFISCTPLSCRYYTTTLMFFQQNGGLVSRLNEPCKTTMISQTMASQQISHLTTTTAKMLHNKTTFTYIHCDCSVLYPVEAECHCGW